MAQIQAQQQVVANDKQKVANDQEAIGENTDRMNADAATIVGLKAQVANLGSAIQAAENSTTGDNDMVVA